MAVFLKLFVNSRGKQDGLNQVRIINMRTALFTGWLFFISIAAHAQDKVFAISSGKGPVITHKVTSGETLLGLARKYNVKASEFAAVNQFDIKRNLKIGEIVKVPLVAANFNQKSSKGTPVYYTVGNGEGLLSVSKKFNKLPVKTLKDWNRLKSDAAPKDKPLVVGYLSGVNLKPVTETAKADEALAKKEEKKEIAKKAEKPRQPTAQPQKKPDPVPEENTTVAAPAEPVETITEAIDESGYFRGAFEKNTNRSLLANRTLMSGVFKTDAGWSDKKYYMLMDGVAPGTIVKISNPQNGRLVYAKVLGNMQDVKYSEGLNIRISDAAAAAMELTDADMFVLNANY